MKIGILECDKVRASLVADFGSYPEMFSKLLKTVEPSLDFHVYEAINGQIPQNIHECDAYVITGSKHGAYENIAWISQLKQLVVELDKGRKKLVGVCFGHQLIAMALGGTVEKYAGGWGVGIQQYEVIQRPAWMKAPNPQFALLATHQDQVLKMPANAELLATNQFCQHAMYVIDEHILTIQAHPEFCKDYCRELIHIRREMIGAEVSDKALESLQMMTHEGELFARWMVDFIKN